MPVFYAPYQVVILTRYPAHDWSEVTEIRGVSHLSLSVRDLDASLAFYRDVLGLQILMEPFDATAFSGREALMLAGRVAIGLQEHAGNDRSAFDPVRTGLDHLAFHVSERHHLDEWMARLGAAGIDHSDVRSVAFGSIVEFRDPDGIQLEVFAPDRPS
jgi:glyoxylase I family protein